MSSYSVRPKFNSLRDHRQMNNLSSGVPSDRQLQESVTRENEIHHDLVQGDFLDTYRNLSYKNIMGQLWASEYCEQVGGEKTDHVPDNWLSVIVRLSLS